MGSSSIALDGGSLQDVLCVLQILMNLLSIYQICHFGPGKIVKFSPHDVAIWDLHNSEMVMATRSVDSTSGLYRFDGFESSDDTGSCLVPHANLISRLWHEHLGHVNYKYL